MLIPTEVEFQSRRKQLKLLLVTLALAIIATFALSRRLVSPRRNLNSTQS